MLKETDMLITGRRKNISKYALQFYLTLFT